MLGSLKTSRTWRTFGRFFGGGSPHVARTVCSESTIQAVHWGIEFNSPGSSVVAFLYRGRQCEFNTKHQSTKQGYLAYEKTPTRWNLQ